MRNELQRRRRRGFLSETMLVKKLEKHGYLAVRVPVSNPSGNPLPDVIARKNEDVFAFEVKTAEYYAYFPRKQVGKLFAFLDQFIPIPPQYKHAVLSACFSRRWVFRELEWIDWQRDAIPDKVRVMKRDRGNFYLRRDRRG